MTWRGREMRDAGESPVNQQLRGAVAVVTGGGRGIGRAIALRLAAAGAHVVVTARSAGEIESVARLIKQRRGHATAIACDVSSGDDVEQLVARAEATMGPIDILVNNAGIAESVPFVRLDRDVWDRTIAVNLTGTYLCTRAILPGMVARGRGRVINIASTAGRTGYRYTAAYCAAKHGVVGLTRSVALEVASKNVTVNAVCPGWVDTDMTDASIARIAEKTGQTLEDARAAIERMNPQHRLIAPDEVAALVLFLAGDGAQGITGQAIDVDGGELMS